jgi:hypothetical protein
MYFDAYYGISFFHAQGSQTGENIPILNMTGCTIDDFGDNGNTAFGRLNAQSTNVKFYFSNCVLNNFYSPPGYPAMLLV